jgi:hypothetical protein
MRRPRVMGCSSSSGISGLPSPAVDRISIEF